MTLQTSPLPDDMIRCPVCSRVCEIAYDLCGHDDPWCHDCCWDTDQTNEEGHPDD